MILGCFFPLSRLAGLSGIYSNFRFIGVFVESAGIIHGWFRFSAGNDHIFVLKVQITCQLSSLSVSGCAQPYTMQKKESGPPLSLPLGSLVR